MVKSTLTLLALFNVAILFPGKAMSRTVKGGSLTVSIKRNIWIRLHFL